MIPALSLLQPAAPIQPQPGAGDGAGFAQALTALTALACGAAAADAGRQAVAAPGKTPPPPVPPEADPLAWLGAATASVAPDAGAAEPAGSAPAPEPGKADAPPIPTPPVPAPVDERSAAPTIVMMDQPVTRATASRVRHERPETALKSDMPPASIAERPEPSPGTAGAPDRVRAAETTASDDETSVEKREEPVREPERITVPTLAPPPLPEPVRDLPVVPSAALRPQPSQLDAPATAGPPIAPPASRIAAHRLHPLEPAPAGDAVDALPPPDRPQASPATVSATITTGPERAGPGVLHIVEPRLESSATLPRTTAATSGSSTPEPSQRVETVGAIPPTPVARIGSAKIAFTRVEHQPIEAHLLIPAASAPLGPDRQPTLATPPAQVAMNVVPAYAPTLAPLTPLAANSPSASSSAASSTDPEAAAPSGGGPATRDALAPAGLVDRATAAQLAPPIPSPSRPVASGPAAQVFAAELRRGARDGRPAPVAMDAAVQALAPSAAAPAAPAMDTRREQWPLAMVERIERMRDDAAAADTRVRLVPDALGSVEVSVRREGGAVHVHFAAEQAATRQLLQDAAPRLAEAAEARGLRLGQMGVGGGQADANGRQQGAATPPALPTLPRARGDAPAEDRTDTRIA